MDIKTTDPINNNIKITVNNKPLLMEWSIQNNIIHINDMLQTGDVITYENYKSKVDKHPSNLIEFTIMKTAISKIKGELKVNNGVPEISFKEINCKKVKRKKIYEAISTEERSYGIQFWENKLGHKINEKTWENLFKSIKETKLTEIQWKILHNIFPTNILLSRMGLKKSENCEFCNQKDFVEHYFVNCIKLGQFWNHVNSFINLKLDKRIRLNEYSILLGIEQDIQNSKGKNEEIYFINKILIIAKLSIIKSKFSDFNLMFIFDNEIKLRNLN